MNDIYFLQRKTKTNLHLIQTENFYIFLGGGGKQQQFKAVLHLLFLCLNTFSSLTHLHLFIYNNNKNYLKQFYVNGILMFCEIWTYFDLQVKTPHNQESLKPGRGDRQVRTTFRKL